MMACLSCANSNLRHTRKHLSRAVWIGLDAEHATVGRWVIVGVDLAALYFKNKISQLTRARGQSKRHRDEMVCPEVGDGTY